MTKTTPPAGKAAPKTRGAKAPRAKTTAKAPRAKTEGVQPKGTEPAGLDPSVHQGAWCTVPLDSLRVAPENARRITPGRADRAPRPSAPKNPDAALRALAASIAEQGLLVPLVVASSLGDEWWEVSDGARRLSALLLLRRERRLPPALAKGGVPVRLLLDADGTAGALSIRRDAALAANLHRAPLHPADIAAAAAGAHWPPERLAREHGIDVRLARAILRVARLPLPVLDLWKAEHGPEAGVPLAAAAVASALDAAGDPDGDRAPAPAAGQTLAEYAGALRARDREGSRLFALAPELWAEVRPAYLKRGGALASVLFDEETLADLFAPGRPAYAWAESEALTEGNMTSTGAANPWAFTDDLPADPALAAECAMALAEARAAALRAEESWGAVHVIGDAAALLALRRPAASERIIGLPGWRCATPEQGRPHAPHGPGSGLVAKDAPAPVRRALSALVGWSWGPSGPVLVVWRAMLPTGASPAAKQAAAAFEAAALRQKPSNRDTAFQRARAALAPPPAPEAARGAAKAAPGGKTAKAAAADAGPVSEAEVLALLPRLARLRAFVAAADAPLSSDQTAALVGLPAMRGVARDFARALCDHSPAWEEALEDLPVDSGDGGLAAFNGWKGESFKALPLGWPMRLGRALGLISEADDHEPMPIFEETLRALRSGAPVPREAAPLAVAFQPTSLPVAFLDGALGAAGAKKGSAPQDWHLSTPSLHDAGAEEVLTACISAERPRDRATGKPRPRRPLSEVVDLEAFADPRLGGDKPPPDRRNKPGATIHPETPTAAFRLPLLRRFVAVADPAFAKPHRADREVLLAAVRAWARPAFLAS